MRSSGPGHLLLLALLGVTLTFLLLPILVVIPSAFSSDVAVTFPPTGVSLRWFTSAVGQPEFLRAFGVSALVAALSTAISLITGALAAYALVRFKFPGRAFLELLFLTPLIFPSIVLAIALTMVLGAVGLLRTFPGLLLAHSIIVLPYAVRALIGSISMVHHSLEEAACTLGATPAQVWRYITFPLIRPGLLAAGVFCLIMSFDEFMVSLFLVGPGLTTLPIELFNYTEFHMDPTVSAVSTILIAISCVAMAVIERTVGLARILS